MKEKLFKLREQNKKRFVQILQKEYKDEYDRLLLIKKDNNLSTLSEAFYWYYYNLNEKKLCEICGKETKFNSHNWCYSKYCSKSCIGKSNANKKRNKVSTKQPKNIEYIEEILTNESIKPYKNKLEAKLKLIDIIENLTSGQFGNLIRILYYSEPKLLKTIYKYVENKGQSSKEVYNFLNDIKFQKCFYCEDECLFKTFFKGYSPTCKKHSNYFNKYKTRWKKFDKLVDKLNNNGFDVISTKEEFALGNNIKRKCRTCEFENEVFISNIYKNSGCLGCYKEILQSRPERELIEFLNQYNLELIENSRKIISPFELDIYLPEKKLAIEYNGLYWHSLYNKNYHLNKTNLCKEKGIQLIHIFEDEWLNKKEIVKSILKSKLGFIENKIFARNCEIKVINNNEAKKFLNENHIQGFINSSLNLGLYFEDELVSLMTFGKRKITGKSGFELLRFCNKKDKIVVGGASKLFKKSLEFVKDDIISYADKRYSNGDFYKKIGFNLKHESIPNYFYIKGCERINRMNFQKHKLESKLKNFNGELTEKENMINNGYNLIYDCGSFVYEYRQGDY